MPTIYEIIFWIVLLIVAISITCFILANSEPNMEISSYHLDRMNGLKYYGGHCGCFAKAMGERILDFV